VTTTSKTSRRTWVSWLHAGAVSPQAAGVAGAIMLIMTVFLGIGWLSPQKWAEVAVRSDFLDRTKLSSTSSIVRLDHNNSAYVSFTGTVGDPSVARLELRIRSSKTAEPSLQRCCEVSNSSFFGSFQLDPATEGGDLQYDLKSPETGLLYASGTIGVQVTTTVGLPSWLAAVMTIVSFVISIIQLVRGFRPRVSAGLNAGLNAAVGFTAPGTLQASPRRRRRQPPSAPRV